MGSLRDSYMPAWLFRRFILRRIMQNPVRVVLLLSAIAVATTLISSVVRVSAAGVRSFENSLGYSSDTYPLTITPRGGRIPVSALGRCLASVRERASLVAYRREVGAIDRVEGAQPIAVVGVTGSGTEQEVERREGQIYLSERAFRQLHISPGDVVTLHVGSLTLTGEAAINRSLSDTLPALAAVVPLSWLSRDGSEPLLDAILVRPFGPESTDTYRASLTEWISRCAAFPVPFDIDTPESRLSRGESLVAAYRFNVMIMAALTLVVCALLVSQATQLSLRNLSRELSILRTLGVGRVACLTAVVQEAALIAVLGALLGVTLGEPITVRITELFLQTAHDIYNLSLGSEPSYQRVERGAVVLGMTLLCVTGAIIGGLDAVRVSPSLGTRASYRHAQPIRLSWALPLALVGVGINVVVGFVAYLSTSTLLAYFFVAASILAVVSAIPLVIVIAPRVVRWFGESLFMWFARGGVTTNGRGFLLGAIGASVSMTLICALSLMVGSFRQTLERWALQRLQGDLFVSAALEGQGNEARIPPGLPDTLVRISGIRRVIPYYETMTSYHGSPLMMSASDTAAQLDRGIYVLRSGVLDRDTLISGRGALASESAARKLGFKVGDTVTIENLPVTILAIIQEFGTEHPLIHIDGKRFLALYPGQSPENLTIDVEPAASISHVRERVADVVGVRGIVRDNRELRDLVLTLFDRTFRITLSIRWIVFGIALIGLTLAALQHLWERRREIKTMHVIGFSPKEIVGAYVVESALVCSLPVLVGLVGGVGLGWGLTRLVNPRAFGWSLHFSFSPVPLIIGVGFIAGVAVVVGCTSRVFLGRTIREATLSDE